MSYPGKRRRIPTPFGKFGQKESKRKRIIVPQPVRRPYYTKQIDLLDWEGLKDEPLWFVLRRRGVHRKMVGEDPLEARAVPESQRKGSLPERIVYLWLVKNLHMREEVDFDFQSAFEGGRLELGGMVADFLFPNLRLILQVQGEYHKAYLQRRKDEEQFDFFAELGYRVETLDPETEIYPEYIFEEKMRKIFGLTGAVGHATGYIPTHVGTEELDPDLLLYNEWIQDLHYIDKKLDEVVP